MPPALTSSVHEVAHKLDTAAATAPSGVPFIHFYAGLLAGSTISMLR